MSFLLLQEFIKFNLANLVDFQLVLYLISYKLVWLMIQKIPYK